MWGPINSTVAFLLSSINLFQPPPSLIVQTPFGKIEGISTKSRSGREIYEFLGIPYAKPPVGELRFKPPVSWNETWDDVRDGTSNTKHSRCIQYHLMAKFFTGSEDCLLLSVYSHKFQKVGEDPIVESELKPVIVYVHGGMFMQGSASFYRPVYFMDEDIVMVAMGYRVGALGFLNLENHDIQGNMGLKDQVEALKWIQSNIRSFGGDPNKVTLIGESAGSVGVHLHLLSPMSKGLFHNAISQSGTALESWSLRNHPWEQAKYFAAKFNCSTDSKEEMARCLRNIPAIQIALAQRDAAGILFHKYALFGPSVETGESNTTERFLPDRPHKIIKSGNINKVPWICGSNSEEGLLYAVPMIRNATIRRELNANWSHWTPIIFTFLDEPESATIANQIREYYFGNLFAEINMDTLPHLVKLVTDRLFFEGMHHALKLHKGQHPVYPYIYSYRREFSAARILIGMDFNKPLTADFAMGAAKNWWSTKVLRKKPVDYGTAHGDELPLMFYLPFQEVKPKSPDFEMSRTIIKTWTAFARDGVPPPMQGVQWPSLTTEGQRPMKFLRLDRNIEIMEDPFESRVDFWTSLKMFPERDYTSQS